MKNLICLFFLPGFFCNQYPLTINPDSLFTWKGSCVLIPCKINSYQGSTLRDISLLWYFQPFYDINQSDYSGHLLYNSSSYSRSRRTQLQSASGSQFVGNLANKDCSLKISKAQIEDSGMYGARIYASFGSPVQRNKWFLNATVNVAASPPVPKMDISPKDLQEGSITVTCSVPYHCPEEPLRLTISISERGQFYSETTTINNGLIQTVVSFQVTWVDHQKSLICSLKRWDWSRISMNSIPLDVKYGPKDVQVKASPGKVIREGETLSLECTVESSNPEVSEYFWYKDDQLMYEWSKHKKIEFETEGDQHSGAYKCEAKNSVASQMSKDLIIDIQYAPKDVQLVIENDQLPIMEEDTVRLNCSFGHSNPRDSILYRWYKGKSELSNQGSLMTFPAILEKAGDYTCHVCNTVKCVPSQPVTVDIHPHSHNVSVPATSAPEPTAESEGPQSSPLLPSSPEGVSSPLPSTSCPPSLPPSPVSIPPLSSSQAPSDGSTQLEEFCFLSDSLEQVMKAQSQFLHSFQELTSAMFKLTEKFQEELIKKMKKTCMVPSEMKNP